MENKCIIYNNNDQLNSNKKNNYYDNFTDIESITVDALHMDNNNNSNIRYMKNDNLEVDEIKNTDNIDFNNIFNRGKSFSSDYYKMVNGKKKFGFNNNIDSFVSNNSFCKSKNISKDKVLYYEVGINGEDIIYLDNGIIVSIKDNDVKVSDYDKKIDYYYEDNNISNIVVKNDNNEVINIEFINGEVIVKDLEHNEKVIGKFKESEQITSFNIVNNYINFSDGNSVKFRSKPFDTSGLSNIEVKDNLKGIDVSEFQGDINWDEVEKDVDFVVLRIGLTLKDNGSIVMDEKFYENIEECKKRNIPVGVYFYSRASNKEEALKETEFMLDAIKGYDLELPMYIDIEDERYLSNWIYNPDEFKETYDECLNKIKNDGYCPGLYVHEDVLNNQDNSNCTFWSLSHETYENSIKFKDFDDSYIYKDYKLSNKYQAYQYCEVGSIDGIDCNVDVDYMNSGLIDYISSFK